MNFLEEKNCKDRVVKEGNVLKVDSFLNHQMDIKLFDQMGEAFKEKFREKNINKILTIEASGIGIACIVAKHFDVPVVFAKKAKSINLMERCIRQRWSPLPTRQKTRLSWRRNSSQQRIGF